MKKATIRDFATSYTTLAFLVMGISGVMMYFHFYDMYVKQLHEILGLIFVAIVFLHVIMNWKSMKSYFSKKIFFSAIIVISLVTGAFVYQSLGQGENPKILLIKGAIKAPLSSSLVILNVKKEDAIKKLEAKDIEIFEENSLSEIADANGISPFKIISIITAK